MRQSGGDEALVELLSSKIRDMSFLPQETKRRRPFYEAVNAYAILQPVAVEPAAGGEHHGVDSSLFKLPGEARIASALREELEKVGPDGQRPLTREWDGHESF